MFHHNKSQVNKFLSQRRAFTHSVRWQTALGLQKGIVKIGHGYKELGKMEMRKVVTD